MLCDLGLTSPPPVVAADRWDRGGGERRQELRRMPRHHYAHVAQRPDRAQGKLMIALPPLVCSAPYSVRPDKAPPEWGFLLVAGFAADLDQPSYLYTHDSDSPANTTRFYVVV